MSVNDSGTQNRRGFLEAASGLAMAGGLVAGYGTFLAYAGRYLYPADSTKTAWMFVKDIKSMKVGESMPYRMPTGASIVVTRQGEGEDADAFLALSSTCPHLGCQVQWEPQNDRFFCPCHNGVFDPTGKGIGGPPGDAGQSLAHYPLKVTDGLLFIEVPVESVAHKPSDGHDPCLGGLA